MIEMEELIKEIARGEHEGHEVSVCMEFCENKGIEILEDD
jgi:hypothetical protein